MHKFVVPQITTIQIDVGWIDHKPPKRGVGGSRGRGSREGAGGEGMRRSGGPIDGNIGYINRLGSQYG